MGSVTYNSTANTSWLSPVSGTVKVEVWGGGGSAGHYGKTSSAHAAGGGGGGAYVRANVTVTLGTTYTIAVGGGGANAANNANGANGVNSQFNNNEIRAHFGGRGLNTGTAGEAGVLASCVVPAGGQEYNGGNGAANAAMVGGGGGAGGGDSAKGANASGATGGAEANNGGGGGNGGASNTAGTLGTIPGGGGGAAGGNLGTTFKRSENGRNGQVKITWDGLKSSALVAYATLVGTMMGKTTIQIAGSTTGVATNVGVIRGKVLIAGQTNGVATNNATGRLKGVLTGSTTGVSTNNSGTVKGKGKLYGQINGVATNNSILLAKGKLYGKADDLPLLDGSDNFDTRMLGQPLYEMINGTLYWQSNGNGIVTDRSGNRVVVFSDYDFAGVGGITDCIKGITVGYTLRVVGTSMSVIGVDNYSYISTATSPSNPIYVYQIGGEQVFQITRSSRYSNGDVVKFVIEGTSLKIYCNGVIDTLFGVPDASATGDHGEYTLAATFEVPTGFLPFFSGSLGTEIDAFVLNYKVTSISCTGTLKGKGSLTGSCSSVVDHSDNFNSYADGSLNGQGGWADVNVLGGDSPYVITESSRKVLKDTGVGVESIKIYSDILSTNFRAGIRVVVPSNSEVWSITFGSGSVIIFNNTGYHSWKVEMCMTGDGWFISQSNFEVDAEDLLEVEVKNRTITFYRNGSIDAGFSSATGGTWITDGVFLLDNTIRFINNKFVISLGYDTTLRLDDFILTSEVTVNVGILKGKGSLAGQSNGTSEGVTGYLQGFEAIVYRLQTNGVATVSGTLTAKGKLYGQTNGVCSVGIIILAEGQLIGQTNGIASNNGILKAKGKLYGQINGVATNNGILLAKGKLYGSTTGIATNNAVLWYHATTVNIAGQTNGVSSNNGILKGKGKLIGAIAAPSTVSGIISGKADLNSITNGIASISALLKAKGKLYGQTTGVATNNLTITGKGKLYGSTTGYATCTAMPILLTAKGIINGIATNNAILLAKGKLYGQINGVSSNNGIIKGKAPITGQVNGIATNNGIVKGKGKLLAQSNGVASDNGVLKGKGVITGLIQAYSSTGGTLGGRGNLTGEIVTSATVSGIMAGMGKLLGITEGIADVRASGAARSQGALWGFINGESSTLGNLLGRGELKGLVQGISEVTGIGLVHLKYEEIGWNSYITLTLDKQSPITLQIDKDSIITKELAKNSIIYE